MGCSYAALTRAQSANVARVRPITNDSRGACVSSVNELLGDCTINEAHMRGVTLSQLDKLVEYTKRRCQDDSWMHERTSAKPLSHRSSSSDGKLLHVKESEIDLYMVVDRVVKPLTEKRKYSYVEFASVNPEEQVPCWFVSHYWGEPIEDFMDCISHFHKRHALVHNSPFWICAYALRQHNLDTEIVGGDPSQEAFARAITSDKVRGTVTILDERLEVYKRAWCCFEATVTIGVEKRLDLVVSQKLDSGKRSAFMIADGPAGADGDNAEAQYSSFPQKVAEEGMLITIEIATASKSIDRNRILNCIAKETVSSDVPPLHHPEFDRINELLRNRFAAIVLRVAVANGDSDGVRRALHCSPTAHLEWRTAEGHSQLEVAQKLASKHPQEESRQEVVAYLVRAYAFSGAAQPSMPESGELNLNQPVMEESGEETDSDAGCDAHSTTQSVKSLDHTGFLRPRSSVSSVNSNICVTQPRTARSSISSATSSTSLLRFLEQYKSNKNTPPRSSPHSELSGMAQGDCFSILPGAPSSGFASSEANSRRSSRCHSDPHLRNKRNSAADGITGVKKKRQAQTYGSLGAMSNVTIMEGPHGSRRRKSGAHRHAEKLKESPSADADIVEKLIEDVHATFADPERIEQSLCTLGTFAAVNVSFQRKACDAGALAAVLTTMKGPFHQLGVLREACRALSSLIFNSKQHASEAIKQGAQNTVKMALVAYPHDSRLLQEGRRALGEMALVKDAELHDLFPMQLEKENSGQTATSINLSSSSDEEECAVGVDPAGFDSSSEHGEQVPLQPEKAAQKAHRSIADHGQVVGKGILFHQGLPDSEAMLARKRFRATSMDIEAQADLYSREDPVHEQQDLEDSKSKIQKHLQSLSESRSAPASSRPSHLRTLGLELGVPAAPQGAALRQEKKAQDSEQVVTGALEKLSAMVHNSESP